jgi:flagellar biosynthesis anti-sigma factor FlgM
MMRIELNYEPQTAPETDHSNLQHASGAGGPAAKRALNSGLAEDQAHLPGVYIQVQALATLASQLPEIRRELVQTLRQAVERGQYHVSPDKVAGALLAHVTTRRAA